MTDLESILKKIISIFNKHSIKYVIVGGLAAIIRGSPRMTSDIDIIIRPEQNITEKLFDAFYFEGFDIMKSQLEAAYKEGFNTSIFIPDSIIRIDLKFAQNNDEFEVLDQAIEEIFMDQKFQMASIEQILYGKILYLGDISDLSDDELLDFNDVRDFINVYLNSPSLDLNWLYQKVEDRNLGMTLKRLIKRANDFSEKSENKKNIS